MSVSVCLSVCLSVGLCLSAGGSHEPHTSELNQISVHVGRVAVARFSSGGDAIRYVFPVSDDVVFSRHWPYGVGNASKAIDVTEQ